MAKAVAFLASDIGSHISGEIVCLVETLVELDMTIRWLPNLNMRATAVAALLLTGAVAAGAQEQSRFPDWSGQWVRGPGMGTGWDPTKPQAFGQQAPLTPEYRAIFEAQLADKAQGGIGGDQTALCLPHGMPRMMIGIYPIEFIVTPKVMYVLTDYTTHRRIYTDGRDWPRQVLPSYNGYSIGKWIDEDGDGRYDVLAVETRGFKGPRTFEGSGMPLHEDNATVIHERPLEPSLCRNAWTVAARAPGQESDITEI